MYKKFKDEKDAYWWNARPNLSIFIFDYHTSRKGNRKLTPQFNFIICKQ